MKTLILLLLLLVNVISISAFSDTCPVGQHWIKAHFRRAYTRADGTFVKATTVSSHCRINRKSDNYWQNKFENNRPTGWPNKEEKSKNWDVEEIERVLEAICELPEEIWEKSEYKIYRMDNSKHKQNPATSAKNILVLYDSAFNRKDSLSRILAHEFAHEIYGSLKASDAKDYRLTTNWFELNQNGKRLMISRQNGFVADDGRASPEEDFANNIEFFLFEGLSLKSNTPHAYRWIREHFDDKLKIRKCEK